MAVDYFNPNYEINKQDLAEGAQEMKTAQGLYEGQDMSRVIRMFIEEDVPDDIKKSRLFQEFWAVFGKTVKLSFIEKEDIQDFSYMLEQVKLDYVMSKAAQHFTFSDLQALDQIEMYFEAAIRKSIGISQHRFNERIIQGGQISQIVRTNTESLNAGRSGGFLGWFRK